MVSCGKIALGEAIDVCVPTGNFGNIFAAFIAKKMGLPIEKLICASNSNNVLTDFLSDGVYDRNRAFYKTISPSMDILISSNLERLLYTLFGSEKNSQYMKELSEKGKYSLTCQELGEVRKSFIGFFADEEATEKTIKDIYNEKKRLIDTHTAVAVNCAQQYKDAYKAERNILVVSTASAYKFAKDVYFAIAPVKECFADDAQAPERLQALTGTVLPAPLANVLTKDVIHTSVIEKDEMDTATLDFAKA
jgi:threonine synthase